MVGYQQALAILLSSSRGSEDDQGSVAGRQRRLRPLGQLQGALHEAQRRRQLTEEERAGIVDNAHRYVTLTQDHAAELRDRPA